MPTIKENKDKVHGPNGPMHAYKMKIKFNLVVWCANIINMKRIQKTNERS
jgi:hypothetical protein